MNMFKLSKAALSSYQKERVEKKEKKERVGEGEMPRLSSGKR